MNDMTKFHTNNIDKLFELFGKRESLDLDVDAAIEFAGTLPSSMQATFIGELLLSVIDGFGYNPLVPTAIMAVKKLSDMSDIFDE
jgi:hypothetical protein